MGRTPLGPRFRGLWATSALSNLADGLLLVAAPLLAASLTRSPVLVSLATVLATLPWLLLSLHVGALADRVDRRRLVAAAAKARAVLLIAAGAAALAGVAPLPLLYAVVFLAGIGEVFSDVSSQSLVPMLVARDRLAQANGRLIATQNVANNFLGAPLAGLLVAVGGFAVFGVAGLLFALSLIALLRLRGSFAVERMAAASLRRDIGEGLSYLLHHRLLRSLAILTGTLNLGFTAYFSIFVLWAVGPSSAVGLLPQAYGLVITSLAVGAVLGSLAAGWIARHTGQAVASLGSAGLMALTLAGPVLWPNVVAIVAALAVCGFANGVVNVVLVSMRQRMIPPALLGRVNSSYRLIGQGTQPMGAILGGVAASLFGLAPVLLGAMGVALAGILVASRHISVSTIAAAEGV